MLKKANLFIHDLPLNVLSVSLFFYNYSTVSIYLANLLYIDYQSHSSITLGQKENNTYTSILHAQMLMSISIQLNVFNFIG